MIKTSQEIFSNLFHAKKKHDKQKKVDAKLIRNLILRSAIFLPRQIRLHKLYQNHDLAWVLKEDVSHYNRLYYPFMTKDANTDQKLEHLNQHLEIMSLFNQEILSKIYNGESILLADLSPYGINIQFKMKSDYRVKTEGDISFFLENMENSETFYTITGIFSKEGFIVGGLQGDEGNKELNKFLTKQCFGMRPQNLLLYCVMEFVHAMGIDYVYGIKKEHHSYKAKRKLRDRIKFDYDGFWSELGDVQELDAFLKFSSKYPLKDISEVQSNKRSMYRKRYEFLENIDTVLKERVTEIYAR